MTKLPAVTETIYDLADTIMRSIVTSSDECNCSSQTFPVNELAGMGHSLLSATGYPAIVMLGLSSASNHDHSMEMSVLDVIVPSEFEYMRSVVI